MDDEKKQHETELARREKEHAAKLEKIVTERYGQSLLAEHEEGKSVGYGDGFLAGQNACVSDCGERIDSYREHGRLWVQFKNLITEYVEHYPSLETDMRSEARAIVYVARAGKDNAEILAEILENEANVIEEALESNDLDRVREIIKACYRALEAKENRWRNAFQLLSLYPQA